jgi:dTDP-4-dehydrorhamnose 3,5-epimerase-like enzyme
MADVILVIPKVFSGDRGCFLESCRQDKLQAAGETAWISDKTTIPG